MADKKLIALQRKLTTGNLRKSQLIEAHNEIADALLELGRGSDAIFHLKEALELTDRPLDRCRIQRMIGEVFMDNNWMLEAEPYFRQYVANASTSTIELQRAYLTLGRFLYIRGCELKFLWRDGSRRMLDEAKKWTKKALEFKNENGTAMESRLYLNLALIVDELSGTRDAVEYLTKSRLIAEQNNHFEELFRCISGSCGLFRKHNGAQRAAQVLASTALKYAKKAGKEIYALWATEYADIQIYLDDLAGAKRTVEEAISYLKSVSIDELNAKLVVLKRLNKHKSVVSGENRGDFEKSVLKLAEIYLSLEMADKADVVLGKMPLDRIDETGRLIEKYYVLKASACKSEQKFHAARELYRKAIAIRRRPRVLLDLAVCMLNSECGQSEIYELIEEAIERFEGRNKLGYRNALEHLLFARRSFDAETSDLERTLLESCSFESLESAEEVSSSVSSTISTDSESATTVSLVKSKPRGELNVSRNAKGETPLHLACIRGHLKTVRRLIESDYHPVNIRDYNGWLPLHEAVNFDHREVVRFLLEHGASINDRGADEGTTPLHDACQNGLLEMIELLLDKGANPAIRNTEGLTPLDILRTLRLQEQSAADSDQIEKCLEIENRMLAHIVSVFPDYKPQDSDSKTKKIEDSADDVKTTADKIIVPQVSATQIYRNAIAGVRRRKNAKRVESPPKPPPPPSNKKSKRPGAFVSDQQYNSSFVTTIDDDDESSPPKNDRKRPIKPTNDSPPKSRRKLVQITSDESQSPKQQTPHKDIRRLCVEVISPKGKRVVEKMLVPFDASRSIGDLGSEILNRLSGTSSRFSKNAQKLKITLRTADDFSLCNQDTLSDVIDFDVKLLHAEIHEN